MTAGLFELIDATGGGCCRVRADGLIDAASAGFVALSGAHGELAGRDPSEVLRELPDLDQLPPAIESETAVFHQIGGDGIGRELAAAFVPDREGGGMLLLVDRSSEARLRRSQASLDRQIDDLKAELAAREREPRRSRIRSMPELARRLDETLARARRYDHPVTLAAIRIEYTLPPDDDARAVGETLLGCVRGVDDLGRADAKQWVIVLPHTPLAGGEVVAKRVIDRLTELGLTKLGVGVAQVGSEEPGSAAVERAEQASTQAVEGGGGLLLAVSLT
jgi:hypothetical protein